MAKMPVIAGPSCTYQCDGGKMEWILQSTATPAAGCECPASLPSVTGKDGEIITVPALCSSQQAEATTIAKRTGQSIEKVKQDMIFALLKKHAAVAPLDSDGA